MDTRIGFIGGGNMASAMIGGLLAAGYKAENMVVSDPWEPSRDKVATEFNVHTTTDNNLVAKMQVVVLAVKPQVMKQVAMGIAQVASEARPLFITIAAGITIPDLCKWLQTNSADAVPAIVRCMPNTPALVQQGATGLYAGASVSEKQRDLAMAILASISKRSYWVTSEALLDVVTGLSGSGPAYFFLAVEALVKQAVDLGLPLDVAQGLAAQTCLGAGQMLIATGEAPAELRKKVTSPNGTTEAGVKALEDNGIRNAFSQAVQKATARSQELGEILGKQ